MRWPPHEWRKATASERHVAELSFVELSESVAGDKQDCSEFDLEIEADETMHTRQELLLRYIYRNARADGWFEDPGRPDATRVVIRESGLEASYLSAPHQSSESLSASSHDDSIDLADIAGYIQCFCLAELCNVLTRAILADVSPGVRTLYIDDDLQIQVLESYEDIHELRIASGSVFVREHGSVLIWAENASDLISNGRGLENRLVRAYFNKTINVNSFADEKKESVVSRRGLALLTPLSTALSVLIIATFWGQDVHEIILEIKADSNYAAMLILLYWPIVAWLSAFFAQTVCITILKLVGPISHLKGNSRFYSGQVPEARKIKLPLVTIQCPVYKEPLEDVLIPAFASVQSAIRTYEKQGGTAQLFVNDDGMAVISPGEALKRRDFYRHQDIAWVARPASSDSFARAGRFKKASNMNFCLGIAQSLAQRLRVQANESPGIHEKILLQSSLDAVLLERHPQSMGEGDVRLGDIILLIDADTRIPEDCLLAAALEFDASPELAILQHYSLAFQVVHNYWEDTMAFFTQFVSDGMMYMTAGGDVAPFIGHNAFLRTAALMRLGAAPWSEGHVSEDFEISMQLQDMGYVVRLATYVDGFREGVSLTLYDEVDRWQKYAYGVSELVFHPIKYWPTRGPFTPLFRRYVRSNIPLSSKFTTLAYMGSYYAIGSQWILAILNFFLVSWYNVKLTRLYQSAFQVIIAVLVLFDVAVPFANAVHNWRRGASPVSAIVDNYKNIAVLSIFFGGLSLHVSQALVWHLLSIPISWGSTAKVLEESHFWREIPHIWQRFRWMYAILGFFGVAALILSTPFAPIAWRTVPSVFASLPLGWVLLCHALMPLILNPQSFLSEIRM
ncbi:hypothetical protein PYCC9005_003812 [Savitreella phatthalungensis]